MFFVISVTDDLHDEQVISEETQTRVVTTVSQTAAGKHAGHLDLASAVVAAVIRLASPSIRTGSVEVPQFAATTLHFAAPLSGRDPPSLAS
jgi:hypothetical protein